MSGLYALPSFVALFLKGAFIVYAWRSPVHNRLAKLYFLLLLLFSLQNLVEVVGFTLGFEGLTATGLNNLGYAYFALAILFIPVLLHISFYLGLAEEEKQTWKPVIPWLYAPILPLEYLLLTGDKLITGFVPFGYTISRVPGKLYFLFEAFATLYMLASLAVIVYGSRANRSPMLREKCKLWLLAISPLALFIIYIITALHFGWSRINSTVFLPIAMTFFLGVSLYTIHNYRLFDIQFFIPWSKVRARKTAFYDRIRAMIAEIADLGSVREAVGRLADTLRCPVALVSTGKPVLAVAGGAQPMVAFPLEQLRQIDRIVVANEIADAAPQTCALMRQHHVAAIVPFYPHSQNASGWMLLGDAFSEQVYTPLDFKMVEELFGRMAELLLDKLLFLRSQLAVAERRMQTVNMQLQQAEAGIATLRSENESLRQQNTRLAQEQAADSLLAADAEQPAAPTITLIGRDKPMLERLRRYFPQANRYVGLDTAGFRRQGAPEVLICRTDDLERPDELLELIAENRNRMTALVYGERAREFLGARRQALVGALIERLPDNCPGELLARKIQALAELRRSLYHVADPDCPLMGNCLAFVEVMREAKHLAGFAEPVLVTSPDPAEVLAVARYLHETAGRGGEFQILRAGEPPGAAEPEALLAQRLEHARGGTLVLVGLDGIAAEQRQRMLDIVFAARAARLVIGVAQADEALRARFRSFAIEMPGLRARRADLPLLVHFFTLQFNLQASTQAYLSRSELDELMAQGYPENMAALKATVFARLNTKSSRPAAEPEVELDAADKTLDEYVAEYESRLIAQTLKRCQGNKSKAARLLGLRPNTLHYKLERYGLAGEKEPADAD